jgi:hypothetical protein
MALIEINWQPTRRDLRLFAVVQLNVAAAIAWILARRDWDGAAIGLLAVAVGGLLVGLAAPEWLRPAYVAWMAASYPIGWVVSHVLLAIVYYGVVTPIGVILRMSGRDTLRLRSRPESTYWVRRPPSPESTRYFRQF